MNAGGGGAGVGVGVGVGWAPGHHGELLQGAFDDGTGRVRRALVTLPQPDRGSRAVFHPSQRHWGVVGTPELVKVRRAAILALREFSTHDPSAAMIFCHDSSPVPVVADEDWPNKLLVSRRCESR